MRETLTRLRFVGTGLILAILAQRAVAHDSTRFTALRARALQQETATAEAEQVDRDPARHCRVKIELVDSWSREPVPGLVRVTNLDSTRPVELNDEFHRAAHWYAVEKQVEVALPRSRLRVEGLRGLGALAASKVLDLRDKGEDRLRIELREFYDTRNRGLYSGNTHLHLMNLTHAESDRYLRIVPQADDLDLVFLSHLRRIPDERNYISNQIVENSFGGGDLARLSESGTLFGNGQEHRHNFGGYGEGFGHVMLLNLSQLIRPVSIGPGIMQDGTDGRPLQANIRKARADGGTVLWCHNDFGFERVPNWAAGLVHAQNIFDGGDHGSYADTFYDYLNVGMRVPFSTGTDWFIYDFSRVYAPVDGELTVNKWLEALRAGKSYITNGTFLELETERATLGGTLRLPRPNRVTVVARGMGRQDFKGLELVYNGKVVHRSATRQTDGYYTANLRHGLEVDKSGWFALRIPQDAGMSELERPLFAHTSPIYVEVAGKKAFDRKAAERMLGEIEQGRKRVIAEGKFGSPAERQAVLDVYRAGIAEIESWLKN